MVALPTPFDARNIDPASGSEPLPAGWYSCVITGSELKDTKKRDGMFLALERKVIDCSDRSFVGRTFIERLNVVNQSAQAAEIAAKQFSAICHVTGVFVVNDTAQLHNIPHRVRLDVTIGDKGTPIGNDVKEYQDQHGNPPTRSGSGPAPVGPAGTHTAVAQQHQQPPQAAQQPPAQAAQQPPAQAAQQPPPAWGAPPAQAAQQPPAAPAWGAPPAAGAAPPPAWGSPR